MRQSTPDICVIYNPWAGRGRARGRIDRLRRDLPAGLADFRPTGGPGEAEALAARAVEKGFAVVMAAGGDGTVHEVANGLLRAGKPEVIFAPLPVGSANDYAYSLGLSDWWGRPSPAVGVGLVDVGRVTSGGRSRFFVNGFGAGFNGLVTRESRRIRRLRGVALYGLAVLRVIAYHFTCPVTKVCLDDDEPTTAPMLGLSLALGRREGNFVVAPQALLDDGLFDYVHGGAASRWQLLVFMAQMAAQRLRADHPFVRMGRCSRATLHSETPLIVHLDGEFFCQPEDDVHDLQVELLPRALRVYRRLSPLTPSSCVDKGPDVRAGGGMS